MTFHRVGRPGLLVHVHPVANPSRLVREYGGDLPVRDAQFRAVLEIEAFHLGGAADDAGVLVGYEDGVDDLVAVVAGEHPFRFADEFGGVGGGGGGGSGAGLGGRGGGGAVGCGDTGGCAGRPFDFGREVC